MKTGIFYSSERNEDRRSIISGLRSRGIATSSFEFGREWESFSPARLRYRLTTLTQVVIISGVSEHTAPWIHFLAGYCLCSNVGLSVFVRSDAERERLHPCVSPQAIFFEREKLLDFIRACSEREIRRREFMNAREALLAKGKSLTEQSLASSIIEADIEGVELFLRIGIGPNASDVSGVPALNLAIRHQNNAIAVLLLEQGASADAISADRGNTPLMEAAGRGEIGIVRQLIARGATLDIQNSNGQNALMLAVSEGFMDTALLLLRNGANPDTRDKLGMSAVQYARLFGYTEFVEQALIRTNQS